MAWQSSPQGERIIPKLIEQRILDGATRTEIRYGPYKLEAGDMMSDYVYNAQTPCDDCYVTGMSVTLKYADGREALASDGVWLHHCVMTSGFTRLISNAAAKYTPGVIWAAANERPTLRLNTEHRYGIDWPKVFSYTVDLASEKDEDTTVYLSITFEHIPKESPQGKLYKGTYMFWNAIGDPTEIPEGRTAYESPPWESTMNGKLLWTSAHLHDGGTNQVLYINDRPVCNSTQFYAQNYNFGHSMHKENGMQQMGGQELFGGDHIESPGACTDFGDIKMGDVMTTRAYYDTTIHKLMTHKGEKEKVMGNMRVFIGPVSDSVEMELED